MFKIKNLKNLIIVILTLVLIFLFVFKPIQQDDELLNKIKDLKKQNETLYVRVDSLNRLNGLINLKLKNLKRDIFNKKETLENLNDVISKLESNRYGKDSFVDGLDVVQFDDELTKYLEFREGQNKSN